VEVPFIPVRKEPVPKRGGLLSRIFCTGLISGTKAPMEPVLLPLFLLVCRDDATLLCHGVGNVVWLFHRIVALLLLGRGWSALLQCVAR
jgi:hypothetical protein